MEAAGVEPASGTQELEEPTSVASVFGFASYFQRGRKVTRYLGVTLLVPENSQKVAHYLTPT